jgi:hypothetical protein
MSLPIENAIVGATMRPRVWLVNTTGGVPQLPQTCNVDDGGTPTLVHIWDRFDPCSVGGLPGREYRTNAGDRLAVLVRVAGITLPDTRTGAIVIAWLPVGIRSAATSAMWAAIEAAVSANLAAAWPCDLDADGATWLVSAMDAAGGAAATVAQNNWPASWRKTINGDLPGVPTGARMIGAMIAS